MSSGTVCSCRPYALTPVVIYLTSVSRVESMFVSMVSRAKPPAVLCGLCLVTCSLPEQSSSIASKCRLGWRTFSSTSLRSLTGEELWCTSFCNVKLTNSLFFFRLTAVILQEQKFADEFLVTPRARQCIGQACRTALISPLIEILATRTDSEAHV